MSTFLLEIVTPERKVYAQDASMVIVKGVEGELGILANHVPLVTPLKIAPIIVKHAGGQDEIFAVHGGFMEVRKDKVVILAESAEEPNMIDIDRAKAAKDRAQRRLEQKSKDNIDHARAEHALRRAINRIEVSERKI